MDMPSRTFGMQARYGFNGKEKDDDINSLTVYDYGFRIFSPTLGRFLSVDPLSESYPFYSPYHYGSNNPIYNIDIDGLEGGKPILPGNIIQGKAGEFYVKTRFNISNAYSIYEQITMRPASTGKLANTRLDLLLQSNRTGNWFRVEVKTGDAISSGNQIDFETSIEDDEYVELRSSKPEVSSIGPKGTRFKISGSTTIRINTKGWPWQWTYNFESTVVNTNSGDVSELVELQENFNLGAAKIIDETIPIEVVPIREPIGEPETPIEEPGVPIEDPIIPEMPTVDPVVEPIIPLVLGKLRSVVSPKNNSVGTKVISGIGKAMAEIGKAIVKSDQSKTKKINSIKENKTKGHR
jgi:RHS repeat-associated protein